MHEFTPDRFEGRFGTPIRHLSVTDSTNSQAMAWAAAGAPEGAVVVADEQTAGRGRRGRSWTGGGGRNLLFSLVLRPTLAPSKLGLVTIAAGVAIARAVEELTEEPAALKWPNDVLVSGRKIAGILSEATTGTGAVGAVIVGVGLNTHWTEDDLPADLAPTATSIAIELAGKPVPGRAEILALALRQLEGACSALAGDAAAVLEGARERSVLLGEEVRVTEVDGTSSVARAVAINDDGALEVEAGGGRRTIYAADVERVRRV